MFWVLLIAKNINIMQKSIIIITLTGIGAHLGLNGKKGFVQALLLSSTSFFNARLQSNNNSNTVSILGHKYVLWTAQSHFNPCLAAQAKMTLSRANAKINSIVLINETTPCLAVATVIAQSQQGNEFKIRILPSTFLNDFN